LPCFDQKVTDFPHAALPTVKLCAPVSTGQQILVSVGDSNPKASGL